MPLQAVKLQISHNNVVGENAVLQLNILETGDRVLTLVVQNSSPTRLRLQNVSVENLQSFSWSKTFGGDETFSVNVVYF